MAVRERRLSSDLCPLPPPLSLLSANPGLSLIDTSGEGAADRFLPSPSIDENLLHNRIDIRAKFNPLATRPACDCSLGRFDTDGKRFWPRSCGSSRNYPRISIADWLGRNESRVVSSEGPRRYVSSICWTKIGRRLVSVETRSMCKGCCIGTN